MIRTERGHAVGATPPLDREAKARFDRLDAEFTKLSPRLKAKTLDVVMLGETHKDPHNKALMQRFLERSIAAGHPPSHFLVEQPDRDQPFFDSVSTWYRANRGTPGVTQELKSKIESYLAATPERSGVSGSILGRAQHRQSATSLLALAIQNGVKVVCLDPSEVFDGRHRDDVWVERWQKVKQEPGFTHALAGMGQAHANVRMPKSTGWVGPATKAAYEVLAAAADTRASRVFGIQVKEQLGDRAHSIAMSSIGPGGLHDAALEGP